MPARKGKSKTKAKQKQKQNTNVRQKCVTHAADEERRSKKFPLLTQCSSSPKQTRERTAGERERAFPLMWEHWTRARYAVVSFLYGLQRLHSSTHHAEQLSRSQLHLPNYTHTRTHTRSHYQRHCTWSWSELSILRRVRNSVPSFLILFVRKCFMRRRAKEIFFGARRTTDFSFF